MYIYIYICIYIRILCVYIYIYHIYIYIYMYSLPRNVSPERYALCFHLIYIYVYLYRERYIDILYLSLYIYIYIYIYIYTLIRYIASTIPCRIAGSEHSLGKVDIQMQHLSFPLLITMQTDVQQCLWLFHKMSPLSFSVVGASDSQRSTEVLLRRSALSVYPCGDP